MKIKMDLKKVFFVGTAGFVIICLGLFYILTNSPRLGAAKSQRETNLENMERKLQSLEEAFQIHKMSMKELEVLALSPNNNDAKNGGGGGMESPLDNVLSEGAVNKVEGNHQPEEQMEEGGGLCSASVGLNKRATQDINMLDVYDLLKFENSDGGVWKQGFKIDVDSSRFSQSNKLKVFVIPHSHNDPGWIKTFEKYFEDQTKHILDNMLQQLSSNPSLKFIWAEISYFNLWWKDLGVKEKQEVIKIIGNKQLEFVTGGWVMPDEANSHFYSILVQLTEGHQWLQKHLNYVPTTAWSIDPFGMSSTMPYILKRSGFSNMLIQRTHYSVKKHLAGLQQLEFRWRQIWDTSDSTDILCHMMPFYSYDVPHTCGPDPKVCCQFDFKRMRGVSSMTCPWNVQPQPIVTHNLRDRSLTLLDQYKKKAMLFKTNILLIPLGDDFRWEDKPEWDAQTGNYIKLFDYINTNAELNTEIGFGTLKDYFAALGTEISSGRFDPGILSGDFFTYADRDDHYWSGYFTSRPFHKAMDRELISHLRAAQILFATMSAELSKKSDFNLSKSEFVRSLFGKLINARRSLSLFQHHDGVTGTSKDHVMVDYAQKLHTGLIACNHVMQKSMWVLTHLKDPTFEIELGDDVSTTFYEPSVFKDHHHSLPQNNRVVLDKEFADRLISVFNPSLHARNQLVSIHVSTYYVKILDIEGNPVDFDVLPVFEDRTRLAGNVFELVWNAEVESLGVKNFVVKHDTSVNVDAPEIVVINSPSTIFDHDKFKIESGVDTDPIFISNEYLTVNFKENGFGKEVVLKESREVIPWDVGMYKYGVKSGRESSGLYLFIPDGPATPLDTIKPFIKVVKGKFLSYVEVWMNQVKHKVELWNHAGLDQHSIHITNTIDIRTENNFELMMRMKSSIASASISHTDLNGFQMIKRKYQDKLPIQANIYPLPGATYVEDGRTRMTLLTRQPLGTGSLSPGEIEVIMDRRLMQDDNRGVGQGDKDNLETITAFSVIFEKTRCEDREADGKAGMLSLAGHHSFEDLLHPFRTFVGENPLTPSILSGLGDYKEGKDEDEIACDVELVDVTILPEYNDDLDDGSYQVGGEVGATLRRVGFDGRFAGKRGGRKCSAIEGKLGQVLMNNVFGDLFENEMKQTTLSFVHEGKGVQSEEPIVMKPMEIYAFKMFFRGSGGGKGAGNG